MATVAPITFPTEEMPVRTDKAAISVTGRDEAHVTLAGELRLPSLTKAIEADVWDGDSHANVGDNIYLVRRRTATMHGFHKMAKATTGGTITS